MANVHSGGGSVTAQIPDEFKGLASGAGQQGQQLQNILPLWTFAGYNPRDISDMGNLTKWGLNDVASLRAVQPGILGSMAALATDPEIASRPLNTPEAENAQKGMLEQLVGGDVGSSPATKAGMQAWEQYVLPTVQHESVQAGLGRSGPGLKAVASSATQAAVPLIQQEIGNRMSSLTVLQGMAQSQMDRDGRVREDTLASLKNAASEMRQLADLSYNQQVTAIEEAFRGGKITEDKQQQLNDAAYDEFLRLQDMAQSVTTGLYGSVIPASIGSSSKQTQSGFGLSK